MRTSFNSHSFESVIVYIRGLCLRREGSSILRIINHEVRIAAELNRSFARKKTKELGCLSAGGIDETMEIEPLAFYAISVESVYSIFERRNSVGNFCKILFTHAFLGAEIEGRMVGCQRAHQAIAQPTPQHVVILFVAQGWGHHELGSLEIGALSVALINEQV